MQNLYFAASKSASVTLKLGLLITLFLFSFAGKAATLAYQTEDGFIKLSNTAYEVAFSTENGAIAYVLDRATGERISEGNLDDNLWSAKLESGDPIVSSAYSGKFSHEWDEASNTLTMTYTDSLTVIVTATVSDNSALKMHASLTNKTGSIISSFEFPAHLQVVESEVQDALLPMMPGALLSPVFFNENRSYVSEYPGIMFADYLAVRSTRGSLALYSQMGTDLQPAFIGYEQVEGADTNALAHSYRTWIEDTKDWSTPVVSVAVGQDYPQSIAGYRSENRIDAYPSLTEKLGEKAPTYFAAPMYKLDFNVLKLKFNDLQNAVINHLNIPGMVHLVTFQTGGHDHNYPDFVPPDTKWGTTEEFASLVSLLQSKGSLAVPYTNFSWWNINSPTFKALPKDLTLNNIADLKDDSGFPALESYGPNSGVIMNVHNDFVREKITEQHNALLNTVGVDAIFEDQWGARGAPFDFNAAGLENHDPSTSYFAGVLDHYEAHAASNLMTEVGVDALAKRGIAFMGTNYLWDLLGYRGATAGVTSYYPMAGMLLRDKVLLYQHDLAKETWTDNKDMLRWNLSQGYGLSIAFYDSVVGGLNMDNPWLNLAGVFQKYALANYADQLVMGYDDLGNGVKKTSFSTYTVCSNWNDEQPYAVGKHILSAGGVVTQANDGSVTAGVFTTYDDQPLSEGDHYLVEVRSPDLIKVFQPLGADTMLHISKAPDWTDVTVTAFQYDGTAIATVEASVSGDTVEFSYAGTIDGKIVGYYEVNAAS